MDPKFRPNVIDSFDFTIQRQLSRKVTLELGYIGRRITHEYLPIEHKRGALHDDEGRTAVLQCLCERGAAILRRIGGDGRGQLRGKNAGAVTPQPFFETALAGTGYCTPGTCTATMVENEGGNLANALVWTLWSDLDGGVGCPSTGCTSVNGSTGAFNFPRSMLNTPIAANCGAGTGFGCQGQLTSGVSLNASVGYGNYNAGFVSLKIADWQGCNRPVELHLVQGTGDRSVRPGHQRIHCLKIRSI